MNTLLADSMIASAALLVLKTSMLLGATWVVAILAERRSAAERHFIWLIGMVGVALLTVTALQPVRWEVPLPLPSAPLDLAVAEAIAIADDPGEGSGRPIAGEVTEWGAAAVTPAAVRSLEPVATGAYEASTPAPLSDDGRALPGGGADALPAPAPMMGGSASRLSLSGAMLLLWAAIASTLLARLVVGHALALRHARRAEEIRSPAIIELCRRMERELGTGLIRMVAGGKDEMPRTGGLLRPWLVLPGDIAEWPRARQESVFRHEVAHVGRRDTLWEIVAATLCAIHWFNPLVWFAAARLRAEREHACDDIVLLAGTAASDYAADLLTVARQHSSGRRAVASVAIAMAKPSRLRSRLTAVLGERRRTREAFSGRGGLFVAAGVPVLLMLGVAFPVREASASDPSAAVPTADALPDALSNTPHVAPEAAASEPERAAVVVVTSITPADPEVAVIPDSAGAETVGALYTALASAMASTRSEAIDFEAVFARAAPITYEVRATLKRSEAAAAMVPARIIGAVQGEAALERMSVGWGGSAQQPQTLFVSFRFRDAAALDGWRSSGEGRAFQGAVAEVSVEGSIRWSIVAQPAN